MTTDFAEKNRQVFESEFSKVVETLINVVKNKRTWVSDTWTDTEAGNGKEIKVLEYACGPGHISLALAPYATRVIGMDISDGMIDEFNKNIREEGRSDNVVAVKANILSDSPPAEVSGPEFFDFDVLVVSMATHHFEHPGQALSRLGERLKEGGIMMIMDLVPEELLDHGMHQMGDVVHTISKHGFSLEEMRSMYENAGIKTGFKYQVIDEPLVFTKNGNTFEKTIFIARGQK